MRTKIVVACSFLGLMLGTRASAGIEYPPYSPLPMFEHGRLAVLEYENEYAVMLDCARKVRTKVDSDYPADIFRQFGEKDSNGERRLISRAEFITDWQKDCFVWKMNHLSQEDPNDPMDLSLAPNK